MSLKHAPSYRGGRWMALARRFGATLWIDVVVITGHTAATIGAAVYKTTYPVLDTASRVYTLVCIHYHSFQYARPSRLHHL
jgi:hypothetical protein